MTKIISLVKSINPQMCWSLLQLIGVLLKPTDKRQFLFMCYITALGRAVDRHSALKQQKPKCCALCSAQSPCRRQAGTTWCRGWWLCALLPLAVTLAPGLTASQVDVPVVTELVPVIQAHPNWAVGVNSCQIRNVLGLCLLEKELHGIMNGET